MWHWLHQQKNPLPISSSSRRKCTTVDSGCLFPRKQMNFDCRKFYSSQEILKIKLVNCLIYIVCTVQKNFQSPIVLLSFEGKIDSISCKLERKYGQLYDGSQEGKKKWPQRRYMAERNLKISSGICPAPCVLCQCTVVFAWKCRLFCLWAYGQCCIYYIYHVEFHFRFRNLVSFPV